VTENGANIARWLRMGESSWVTKKGGIYLGDFEWGPLDSGDICVGAQSSHDLIRFDIHESRIALGARA
jgi:hypothetical protein